MSVKADFRRWKRKVGSELRSGAPEGSVVTISEFGFINSTLFVEWIKHV